MIKRQDGFTLVELLIAMTVFSFMLVIVSTGFIRMVRVYQAGVASRTTQQNARLVMDGIMKDVRVSGAVAVGSTAPFNTLCLAKGSQTLEYAVDLNGDLRVSAISNPGSGNCPAVPITSSWATLNDSSTKVTQFAVTRTAATGSGLGSATVTLTLASRTNLTALNTVALPGYPIGTQCQPGAGSQYCAVTTITSGASLRGGENR